MKTDNLLLVLFAVYPVVRALWPMPRSLQTGTTLVKLSPSFSIEVDVAHPPQDLLDAVSRTNQHLKGDMLQRLIVGRASSDTAALVHAPSLTKLSLTLAPAEVTSVKSIMAEATKDIASRREGYSLTLPASGGAASIVANSTLGLFRGLTTFEQLWYADSAGDPYTYQAPVIIADDSPAYPYRGFMLDTARNFFSVSDIKRTLDAMSMVKMSQFHWHVVDSQSFPLSIPDFPELSQNGAYSSSEVYSSSDVQDIVTYAGTRGIDVLMEIDTPGHTAIISTSHPEHVACAQATPWENFANEPPAGQLRLASAATTNFTTSLITSIAKTLPSTLFSTGGDELNVNCYTQDAQTQAELDESGKTLEEALNTFTQSSHDALKALGKTPVVWEEMALDHNVTLSNSTVIMVWISSQDAAAVAAKNLRIVHSPSDYFYLDCGAGEWIGNDPAANSWCDPFKSWQKAYTFDPLANLTEAQTSLVLGGQQLLWAEQSGPENLDSIAWPRAAASAEVFWTGATLPDGTPLNGTTALPRLHDVRFRMVQRGINAIALQPQWCALRDGQCNM
ncbi:glycoside hydrolase family 20 protein [Hypholoma sublateritium FD-334 SS-4]|uniref:Beta-hexosaminidase n=1 Tax=Hypholoma sublateritium (strain FD-334 SS-4) TaxID=945553 RepID=A0A0D2P5J8_HYPSF|nr:glycoside hydrolase family 20 protein [Hypholoma sublateritium FD-334 SS-4]